MILSLLKKPPILDDQEAFHQHTHLELRVLLFRKRDQPASPQGDRAILPSGDQSVSLDGNRPTPPPGNRVIPRGDLVRRKQARRKQARRKRNLV